MLLDKFIVERLIEIVKKKPILYDITQRKNSELKESTWQEIALELGVNESALRRKWKNLKDCYRKHLRANSEDETNLKVKSYRRWGWSQQLEFLRPHVDASPVYNDNDETLYCDSDVADIDDIKIENRDSDSASNSGEIKCYIEEITPIETKRRRLNSIKISEQVPSDERGLDAIEHIFLGYAKTIKALPVKSQIYVKMKIAKLIMEEELKYLK